MDPAELVRRFPTLFHMAAAGAWPSIRDHGLWPADRIVRTAEAPAELADRALALRRESVHLRHPVLGDVVLRDQGPLRLHRLEPVLVGLSVEEWLALLNDRVFFWLHPAALDRLLGARRYRDLEHDVLEVDTAGLLAAHSDRVRLSPINSGSALWPNAPARGAGTFTTVEDYP